MEKIVDTAVGRLEKSSQIHEKEIVAELGIDRIVRYIVLLPLGLLAIATIIFTVIGKSDLQDAVA